jgi:drug/metabolite transporter (DMT)-like permease
MQTDPPSLKSARRRTIAAFATVYVVWSSTYLAIRIGVSGVPPFAFAGVRFVIAGTILWAIARSRGISMPKSDLAPAAVSGALLFAGGNGLVTWAETSIPSNIAAVMIALVPAFMAFFDWLRPGGRAPRAIVVAGIATGLVGVSFLVTSSGAGAGAISSLGILALLGADVAWAGATIYMKVRLSGRGGLATAAVQVISGGVCLLAVSLANGESVSLAAVPARSYVALAYLAVFGSVIAYSAYVHMLEVASPVAVSTTAYVNPVLAVVLGWIVLGEELTARQGMGAAAIVVGVVLMTVPFRALARRYGKRAAICEAMKGQVGANRLFDRSVRHAHATISQSEAKSP